MTDERPAPHTMRMMVDLRAPREVLVVTCPDCFALVQYYHYTKHQEAMHNDH